jgi:hypothetical protein|tara:strand:- start:76 stop:543 length:468 start_codon:yes stop_codon:yes gene_type:complete
MAMTKKEKEFTVLNMAAAMCSDGEVAPEEMGFLAVICENLGFTPEEFMALSYKAGKNPESFFTPAKDVNGRVNQLTPAVMMMMRDGALHEKELEFCTILARVLGFEFGPETLPGIVKVISEHIVRTGTEQPDGTYVKEEYDINAISAEIQEFLEE